MIRVRGDVGTQTAGIIVALVLFTMACAGQAIPALNFSPTATPVVYRTATPPEPTPTPTTEPTSYKVTIVLDPSLTGKDTSITAAWTAYAAARAEWIQKNVSVQLVIQGGYHRTLDEEVAGRSAMALVWKSEKKAEPLLHDPYLDQLLQIYGSGFIREYTWSYFGDSAWEQPKDLYLKAYTLWVKSNLKQVHIPQTLADVQITLGK
jgi:hypothetical protein